METALLYDRLQFAVTITFHYLFPQLTMGLALLLVYFKTRALWTKDEHFHAAARFWTNIFALAFAFGVVTGIPMEFQFGTNWAKFSTFAGGVIGQTLAMEGVFAFFLESSFLGLLLFGERRLSPRVQWLAAIMVFLGAWLSAYFILATNAWMQHPVGYTMVADGSVHVDNVWAVLSNPWLGWQFAHNMSGSVATASLAMAGVGAFYQLAGWHPAFAKTFLRTGIVSAALACSFLIFPTGHEHARLVFDHQPVTGAAMEGLFETKRGAGLLLIGQPNMESMTIDNPLVLPGMLSFLVYDELYAEVKGLTAFPREEWPDNIPLLYYAYHIMAGLGTLFALITVLALCLLWKDRLFRPQWRWLLWILMLIVPLPFVANTAGWMTAELGRQPWLVYGLFRTADGISPVVHSGNALFTLIGFLGIYGLLGITFILLVVDRIARGPHTGHGA
ncbi:MAG: cytochrome ubiquinol oxidase subunit I [Nitrospirae bacterium]|nr:MAG: cytochrome ubiquinol oxidase subunit I [Nitrospirota bacterium]